MPKGCQSFAGMVNFLSRKRLLIIKSNKKAIRINKLIFI